MLANWLRSLSLIIFLFTTIPTHALQRHTITNIENFKKDVMGKVKKDGPASILVVYDFDNTLMAMDQDIGSDQWFNWQSQLLKDKTNKDLVAKDIDHLLSLQLIIFSMGKMHPVEGNTASVAKEIQSHGVKSIILTSRGPKFRVDTEEELQHLNLSFEHSAIGPEKGYPGTFHAEDKNGIREVSYQNGIAMGSGVNKGLFMKLLLAKTGAKFDSIYFLDDTLKNIENMENAFNTEFDLHTYHYTFEEKRVKTFEANKEQAKREWNSLAPILKNVFKLN